MRTAPRDAIQELDTRRPPLPPHDPSCHCGSIRVYDRRDGGLEELNEPS